MYCIMHFFYLPLLTYVNIVFAFYRYYLYFAENQCYPNQKYMVSKITLILLVLVAINFILLFISTNKIKKVSKPKVAKIRKPVALKKVPKTITTRQIPSRLSPTGS